MQHTNDTNAQKHEFWHTIYVSLARKFLKKKTKTKKHSTKLPHLKQNSLLGVKI